MPNVQELFLKYNLKLNFDFISAVFRFKLAMKIQQNQMIEFH